MHSKAPRRGAVFMMMSHPINMLFDLKIDTTTTMNNMLILC